MRQSDSALLGPNALRGATAAASINFAPGLSSNCLKVRKFNGSCCSFLGTLACGRSYSGRVFGVVLLKCSFVADGAPLRGFNVSETDE